MIDPDAVVVYECGACGRLWVGVLEGPGPGISPHQYTFPFAFSKAEREEIGGRSIHYVPGVIPQESWWSNVCGGVSPTSPIGRESAVKHAERPDVVAAFVLGGKHAAESMWRKG